MTVQDLLTAALRGIGVVASEETPSPSELTDAQLAANDILASWSAQVLPITPITRETFPLIGSASYTIGPSANFSTTRPVKIETLAVVATNGARKPVHIATVEQWETIVDTTATGLFADEAYYDGGYPTGTIYLYPKPTGGNLEIQSYKQLTQFANLSDTITLAPGYTRALRWALAFDLAPEFGRPVTQELVALAQEAKMSITGLNQAILGKPNQVEPTPPGVPGQAAA